MDQNFHIWLRSGPRGGADPPPYGQPDRKKAGFFLTTALTIASKIDLVQMYTSVRTNSQVSSLACRAIDRNGLTNPNSQDSNVFRFLSHQNYIIDINPEEKSCKIFRSDSISFSWLAIDLGEQVFIYQKLLKYGKFLRYVGQIPLSRCLAV